MDRSINRRQGNIFSSRASLTSTAKNVSALGVVRLIMSRISPLPCPSLVPSSSNELVIIFDCLPISVHVNPSTKRPTNQPNNNTSYRHTRTPTPPPPTARFMSQVPISAEVSVSHGACERRGTQSASSATLSTLGGSPLS